MNAQFVLVIHIVTIWTLRKVITQSISNKLPIMTHLSSCNWSVVELKCLDLIFFFVVPENHLTFATSSHHEEIISTIELNSIHWEKEAMISSIDVFLNLDLRIRFTL